VYGKDDSSLGYYWGNTEQAEAVCLGLRRKHRFLSRENGMEPCTPPGDLRSLKHKLAKLRAQCRNMV
jgi:hypothetical protein